MPGARYDDVDRAFVEAAHKTFTVEEVAAKLGRTELSVYQLARSMGVTFLPKPLGSLELKARGAFVIPDDELDRYQELVSYIGRRCGLTSKNRVFLRALELAALWLEDEEKGDDTVRVDRQAEQ